MAAKPCLLVVDDEPDLVQSVKDLLRFDFRVLGATRASEGLRIMDREHVQVIMSDQRMPEMTGVELLGQVKVAHPDTVRLLFTAYSDLSAVIDAINQGSVYRYIAKPWRTEELKTVLKQAVEYYELQEERRNLVRTVQQKNEQLEAANAELRHANEMKKGFIKVASHELRTPLTILMGFSELAAKLTKPQPELHNWMERIHAASARLHDRVDQMVKLLLSERFERPLQRHEVEVAFLLRDAASEIAGFVTIRQQELRLEIPDDLGSINVEADKIRDSLVQLLMNAVKFTPNGGKICLSAMRTADGRLRIAISDTGMGIDPQALPRIFEPFFTRFDVSHHSSGTFEYDRRGLGLGLSVARAFIEMHGGEIQVVSKLEHGTTFTINL
jgi:signal transduction histidine kinase